MIRNKLKPRFNYYYNVRTIHTIEYSPNGYVYTV